MSITIIESRDQKMLDGFEAATLFFTGADVERNNEGRIPCLIITADDDFDNHTYTLTKGGLFHKHSGVEI